LKTYKAGHVPDDPAKLPGFLRQELLSVQQAAQRADAYVGLSYLAVAPERPQDGLYLSAAGVLGVTRGAYRYDSTTGLYTFLA
jgi:hypothetical protein